MHPEKGSHIFVSGMGRVGCEEGSSPGGCGSPLRLCFILERVNAFCEWTCVRVQGTFKDKIKNVQSDMRDCLLRYCFRVVSHDLENKKGLKDSFAHLFGNHFCRVVRCTFLSWVEVVRVNETTKQDTACRAMWNGFFFVVVVINRSSCEVLSRVAGTPTIAIMRRVFFVLTSFLSCHADA